MTAQREPNYSYEQLPDGSVRATPDRPLCDFCGGDLRERWTRFVARPFSRSAEAGGVTWTIRYTAPWAACPRCELLVHNRAWKPLVRRCMRVRRAACWHTPVGWESELAATFLQLADHLTGEQYVQTAGDFE